MDVLAFCTAAHCQLPSMDCFVRGQTRITEVGRDPKRECMVKVGVYDASWFGICFINILDINV